MKVSIVTVVYNNERTIERCIKSVLNQSYGNIEHIIIDGLSTDNTLNIIEKYKDQIDILISEKDEGIYDAMNKGYQKATGDIIGILNSDDYFFADDSIEKIVNVFQNNNIKTCYGDMKYVDEDGNTVRNWITGGLNLKNFKRAWIPPHPTFYAKKSVFEQYGLYDTSMKIAADYDLIFRLLAVNELSTMYINSFLVNMEVGGVSNNSIRNLFSQNHEIMRSWKKYGKKICFICYIMHKFALRKKQRAL